ncbi:MAG TPA: MerR family transcriptional regulator [Burkholderiaceae bacterium]
MGNPLPPIPAKRYFTIGEMADLCGVKPHVLRYWEQEFTQLRPMKRRGNRRYYQHHEVLMIRRIRDLLYEQGFTISGARNKLQELVHSERMLSGDVAMDGDSATLSLDDDSVVHADGTSLPLRDAEAHGVTEQAMNAADHAISLPLEIARIRRELMDIREILAKAY